MILRFFFIYVAIVLSYNLSSCSKKQDVDEGNLVGVNFNIVGIEDENSELVKLGSNEKPRTNSNLIYSKIVEQGDDNYVVSVSEERFSGLSRSKELGEVHKLGATVPMASNISYRVLIYDENDAYVATLNGNSSSALNFNQIRMGKVYKWFAYSYNTSASIPALANNTSPAITSTSTGGLLYDSGQFTSSNTAPNNRVSITFKRKTSVIELIINGRGIFDEITAVQLASTLTGLKSSGQFNLKNGTYTSYTAASPVTNYANTSFTQFKTVSKDTIRKIELYTVDGVNPLPSFGLTFSGVSQRTDLSFAPVSRSRSFTTSSTINIPIFTPQLGRKYRIVYTPLYRAFTLPNGVRWAMGNLYYDANRKAYAFLHFNSNYYADVSFTSLPPSPAITPRQNLYWKWRALLPGTAGVANSGDPCTKVYPEGLWKMPTAVEFESINFLAQSIGNPTSSTPTIRSQHSGDPLRYLEARTDVTQNKPFEPYNWHEAMVLMQLGYYNGSNQLVHYRTTSNDRAGLYFWASDVNVVSSVGRTYSITTLASNTGIMYKNITQYFSENSDNLLVELLTVPVTNNFRLNIRCVRNSSFTTYIPKLP